MPFVKDNELGTWILAMKGNLAQARMVVQACSLLAAARSGAGWNILVILLLSRVNKRSCNLVSPAFPESVLLLPLKLNGVYLLLSYFQIVVLILYS